MKIDIHALLHGSTLALPGKKLPAAEAFQEILAGLSDELSLLPELKLALSQGSDRIVAAPPSPRQQALPIEPEKDPAEEAEQPDATALLTGPAQIAQVDGAYPQWQLQQMVTDSAQQADTATVVTKAATGNAFATGNPVPVMPDGVPVPISVHAPVQMSAAALNADSRLPVSAPQPVAEPVPASPLKETVPGDAGQGDIAPAVLSAARLPVSAPVPAPMAMPVAATHSNPYPVGSAAWQHSLGQQLTLYTRDGVQNAEIRLHPEEMGALHISVRMQQDRAQLHIVSEHLQVRQALEAAIPQLRSALAESGVQLGQTQVSAETADFTGSGFRAPSGGAGGQPDREDAAQVAEDESERLAVTPLLIPTSGINTFA